MKVISPVADLVLDKVDKVGRRLALASEREAVVAAYRVSGLTQREFAAREGINFHTFCNWLQKSGRRARRGGQSFIEVRPTAGVTAGYALEVLLPSGLTVRGQTGHAVAELVQALR